MDEARGSYAGNAAEFLYFLGRFAPFGNQIGDNPGCAAQREGDSVARPVEMIMRHGEESRRPYQQLETDNHRCQQT